jgi:hypothetical protein
VRTVDLANGAALIWRPMGRPALEKPQGWCGGKAEDVEGRGVAEAGGLEVLDFVYVFRHLSQHGNGDVESVGDFRIEGVIEGCARDG